MAPDGVLAKILEMSQKIAKNDATSANLPASGMTAWNKPGSASIEAFRKNREIAVKIGITSSKFDKIRISCHFWNPAFVRIDLKSAGGDARTLIFPPFLHDVQPEFAEIGPKVRVFALKIAQSRKNSAISSAGANSRFTDGRHGRRVATNGFSLRSRDHPPAFLSTSLSLQPIGALIVSPSG